MLRSCAMLAVATLVLLTSCKAGPKSYPNAVIATIPVGGDPHGIACLPNGSRVYVANESVDEVYVLDASQLQVTDTIICGDAPWQALASPDNRYVAFHTGMSEGGTKGDPEKHRCFHVMRRSDGPVIQPGFGDLRGLYPDARTGPVLQPRFPNGQPLVTVFVAGDWTYAEIGGRK